ncbi:aspartate/glutamate racemase family protein [Rossellomorea marisflavi]|uniref:aspartate/glutamate racemase family protein n=1 Tax=Rossellomorea marisflavi TaxID=189381 RepID=UPI00203E9BC3|nr:aspartate/glutamate racemase family protein [Rossellomorea marisflavi]MCM2605693.1 aspartate/glutamate racemase family protein [Rossellomorea marisflavi]USK93289.1 aspartate/glutamate racemase family protein [Rossellomorea marisflavi]
MKTIGLLGGMSWESSSEYYRLINQGINRKLGGHHSAKSIMVSVDFEEVKQYQHHGEWDKATGLMIEGAQQIERGGADFLLICTNTMHKMADDVQKAIDIPLIHIADATAQTIKDAGLTKIGLLGTAFTMEEEFYKGRLSSRHGLEVVVPDQEDRQLVHDIIYRELCLGKIVAASKMVYQQVIEKLIDKGCQGVILGCTEISLLIKQGDVAVPLFDTTALHAEAAVTYALVDVAKKIG